MTARFRLSPGWPVIPPLLLGAVAAGIAGALATIGFREALRLADAFRARVIDATTESFVFELTGASSKIEQFVALMLPLGLAEVSRTGIAAIRRGPEAL